MATHTTTRGTTDTAARKLSSVFVSLLMITSVFAGTVAFAGAASAQEATEPSFGAGTLAGADVDNPSSLQFGPDGRLYVAERFGQIHVFNVTRNSANDYEVTSAETIETVQNLPNHDGDGNYQSEVGQRQVTGLVVGGTADSPVLYVSSSDPRVGGGGSGEDLNLDTNSGVISKLTPGDGGGWDHEMLVRGLPRSEENHATNGLELSDDGNTLYVAQGGHANKGAPSNNFAYTPEYALSAAILEIDLDQVEGMSEKNAANTEATYRYDLPTIGDSPNQPFGGQDGQNMAKLVADGPVSIYSPGYRNAYDVTLTEDGQLYTFDNGANSGWGGTPVGEGTNQCANEPNEGNDATTSDNLHLVEEGTYGGHPNPVRGNPDGAGLYDENGDQIGSVADAVYDGYDNPVECEHQNPDEDGSLTMISSSTNGLDEYTASNFGGAMQGDLLTAAFDDNVYRIQLNGAGDSVTEKSQQFSADLSTPLDVTAQGDDDAFPGTVWVADFGGDDINVFEPTDFGDGGGGGETCDVSDPQGDADGDGYTNGDEQSAGTDPCSAGSVPEDYDGDNVSNLNDPDDDNDGLADTEDPFAVDPDNGLSTTLPVEYDFSAGSQPDSLEGIGFTGLMTNGQDYQDLYVPEDAVFGGASPILTQEVIKNGDAFSNNNNQQHAYQFGIDAPSEPFVVHAPVTGYPENPENFQSAGIQLGTGDQDDYLKLVVQANGGDGGVQFAKETNGDFNEIALPTDSSVNGEGTVTDLYMTVYPSNNTVVASYAVDGGATTTVGSTTIPDGWLSNQVGGQNVGLATGVIATSNGAPEFSATWEDFSVTPLGSDGGGDGSAPTADAGTDTTVEEGSQVTLDGSGSSDPNGDQLGYSWTQTTGPDVSLSSQDSPTPSFDAPEVNGTATLTFELEVSDSESSDTDTVEITVEDTDGGSGGGDGSDGETVFAVNAGGSEYTATDGTVYAADTNFDGGSTSSTSESIDGTEDDPLYQSERYGGAPGGGPLSYDVPVENGEYEVTLQFAEIFHGAPNGDSDDDGGAPGQEGDRVFDANIEGGEVELAGYDIFADVGALTATDKTYTANVTDGTLNIDFSASADNAKISAIEVVSTNGSGDGGDGGDGGSTTSADVAVNAGSGDIDASTFDAGSFTITNTGDTAIESATIDLSESTLPDAVFDPEGTAGDSGSKDFTVDGPVGGTTEGMFSQPHNGEDGSDGYDALDISFTDFQPGETLAFSVDIDPTSIKNVQSTGGAGSVSGLELSGSAVTVESADASVTNDLFTDGSQGGSQASAVADAADAPTLSVQGVTLESTDFPAHSAATVGDAGQTLAVSGPAGATVELLHIVGNPAPENGYDIDAYETDSAQSVETQTVALDGNGEGTVDVSLTEGSLDYFVAAVENGDANGQTSETVVLELDESAGNQPPVADADADQTVAEGSTVELDASNSTDSDGDTLSYEWTQTGGPSVSLSGASSATPTFTAPGVDSETTLTFEVAVSDGNGNTATDSVAVTVTPTDDAAPTISDFGLTNPDGGTLEVGFDSDEALADIAVEITDGNGDVVTTLETGDFSSSAGTYTATFEAGSPDEYTATLVTAADEAGNDGAVGQSDSVTIEAPNGAPTAAFTVGDTPTAGQPVTFDASGSSDDSAIASYTWEFGDGATATGQQVSHTYDAAGEYEVTLTVTDDEDATDSTTQTVLVAAAEPEQNTLRIVGSGSYASYEFGVSGSIDEGASSGLTGEDSIASNGKSASGAVGGGADEYVFSGDLGDLTVTGDATVYLNGEEIEPTTERNRLRVVGSGERASYSFGVGGTIDEGESSGLTGEDAIAPDGKSASGAVGGGQEEYVFSGNLENLVVDGDATVYLNGEQIDPSEYRNTLRIVGSGERASYSFGVGGSIDAAASSGITGEDSIADDGTSASGAVGGGADEYVFSGELGFLAVDGDATVYLNGEQIEPRNDQNVLKIVGSGERASYSFGVGGSIDEGESSGLTGEDAIAPDDKSATGAVGGGADEYVFSGDLEALTLDGDATVYLNGEEIDPADYSEGPQQSLAFEAELARSAGIATVQ